MTEADAPALAALDARYFSESWSEKAFLDTFVSPTETGLVLEDEELCGYITAYFSLDEGNITRVLVEDGLRRQGLGKRLVEALFAAPEAGEMQTCFLEVREHNQAAIALYESCGFAAVGKRKRFYRSPEEDALVMRCQVKEG